MPRDLSVRTIALVKAAGPALESHGLAMTRRMYERRFQDEAIRDLHDQFHHGETRRPRFKDRRGPDHDEEGLITIEWLDRNTPMQEVDHFHRGPRAFLRTFVGGLARVGVASGLVRHEFSGPADELFAP